jgi:hypothetical protein
VKQYQHCLHRHCPEEEGKERSVSPNGRSNGASLPLQSKSSHIGRIRSERLACDV